MSTGREQKRVVGVRAYLKEEFDFKIHEDLNRLDTPIEQLWLEIKGKNKKSSILLGIVYQLSPQVEEKMECLDIIETMLSIIASTFTGIIILAACTNTNVNDPSRPQKRYQEILENFNLVQHIN